MEDLANADGGSKPSTFRTLRALFVAGYIMNLILWFVPAVKMKLGGFMGVGGDEGTFSMFSIVHLLSQRGNLGLTIFFVALFASNIAFVALALSRPRRWVFITASSVAAFFILLGLFSGSNEGITHLLVPRILSWGAEALTLLGFVIKPPASLAANVA